MAKTATLGFVAAALALAVAACSPFGGATVFSCDSDTQCGAGGMCEPEKLCSFESAGCPSGRAFGPNSGPKSNQCVGGDVVDAMPDMAPPTMCTAGVQQCFEGALETCNATGTGFDPQLREVCPLTCIGGACVAASNIPIADQISCGAGTLALTPPAGATVTLDDGAINCAPSCGTAATIPRTGTTPNDFYCLASINLPATVTVVRGTQTAAVTWFSAGTVVIAADLDVAGGDATGDLVAGGDTPGAGGPGGYPGAIVANGGNGNNGMGQCPGLGGLTAGSGGNAAGAGGGGAGHQAAGGNGGNARSNLGVAANGGAGGGTCGNQDARPLVGGSGGGGGADGACGAGVICGWPGGGGGGALHVASRLSITVSGDVDASGGTGFGETTQPAGGGGGGAGGTLMFEAPTLAITGQLVVDGGTGGVATAGLGGAGGSGGTAAGANGSAAGATLDRSGGGGGGGGGRVRLNAMTGAVCTTTSPAAGCSTGVLRTSP